jgi:homeobox-leucine zipper protein
LEVIRLEGHSLCHDEVVLSRDMYLLQVYDQLAFSLCLLFSCVVAPASQHCIILWQLCSGVDENAAGACAQLVFAPIDESFADDAPLLPSGFRVIPLDAKTVSTTGFVLVVLPSVGLN